MRQPAMAFVLLTALAACGAPDRQRDEDVTAVAPGLGADSGAGGVVRDSAAADSAARNSVPADTAHAHGTATPGSATRGTVQSRRPAKPSDTTSTTIATSPRTPQMSDTTPADTSGTGREPKPTDFRPPERRPLPPELERPLGVPRDTEPARDSATPAARPDETGAGA